MPIPPAPQGGNDAQPARPPKRPNALPPDTPDTEPPFPKQPRIDPDSLFPKKLHFAIVGELSAYEADYIELWARTNPEYEVTVWRDSASIFDPLKSRIIAENAYRDAINPDKVTRFEEIQGLLFLERQAAKEIIDDIASRRGRLRAVKLFIKFSLEAHPDPELQQELDSIKQQQDRRFARLQSLNNIKIREVGELLTGSAETQYAQFAYVDNDFTLASNLVRLWALANEGGFTFDSRTLPPVDQAVFASESVALEAVPDRLKGLLENAKLQALLNRYSEVDDWGSERAALASDYPDYIAQLREEGYPDAADALIRAANTTEKPYFEPIGDVPTHGNGLVLGSEPDFSTPKPLAIGAVAGASELEDIRHEYEQLLRIKNKYERDENAIIANYVGEERAIRKQQLARDIRQELKRLFSVDPDGRLPITRAEFSNLFRAVKFFEDRGILPGVDPFGDFLGFAAYERHLRPGRGAEAEIAARMPGYSVNTEEFIHNGFDSNLVPKRFYRKGRGYDKRIIVSLSDKDDIFSGDAFLYLKDPEHTLWLRWDDDSKRLVHIEGTPFEPGPLTKIYISEHYGVEGKLGPFDPAELVVRILSEIIPRGRRVQRIALCGCSLEGNLSGEEGTVLPSESFSAKVLDIMSAPALNYDIGADTITAPSQNLRIDALGHKIYAPKGDEEFRHKPGNARYVFFREPDGTIKYRAKPGDEQLAPEIFKEKQPPSRSIESFLKAAEFDHENLVWEAFNSELNQGNVLLPADTRALVLGMTETETAGTIVIADMDAASINGIRAALYFAGKFERVNDWIAKVREYFPDAAGALKAGLDQYVDRQAAFERLKGRAEDGFDFFDEDPASERGSALINEQYIDGFSGIHVDSLDLPAGAKFEDGVREKAASLSLLSDDQTRIRVGDSAEDIALHDTSENPVLDRIKEKLHQFRRSMASARVSGHEGYHNYIALDNGDSLTAAKALAEKGKGRALVYDSEHELLLTEDGRVVTSGRRR